MAMKINAKVVGYVRFKGKLLAVCPTYWKLYVETLSRKKPKERSPQLNLPQVERD
jgi:hypothetical protein